MGGNLEAGSGRRCESEKCPVYYYYYYYCSSSSGRVCVCDKRLRATSRTNDAQRLSFKEAIINDKGLSKRPSFKDKRR